MDCAIEMDDDYELARAGAGPRCAATGSPGPIRSGRSCRSGTRGRQPAPAHRHSLRQVRTRVGICLMCIVWLSHNVGSQ